MNLEYGKLYKFYDKAEKLIGTFVFDKDIEESDVFVKCGNCFFWVKYSERGYCRYNPPSVNGCFPETYLYSWCGQFRKRS